MNRRGFLQGILAAAVAPYVVTTAGVLMPVRKLSVVSNALFTGEWGHYDGVRIIVNYMTPLSGFGISGGNYLSGNEESLGIYRLEATIPEMRDGHHGDTLLVGKIPPGSRILNANVGVYTNDDGAIYFSKGA